MPAPAAPPDQTDETTSGPPATPHIPGGRSVEQGVVFDRKPLAQRFNAWRKRSALNPYWIEMRLLREAVRKLAPQASGRLLDVGVAERPYDGDFAPYVERYVGLEYPVVVNNLNPEIWKHLDRVQGIVDVWGDGNRLPFANESFDTVLSVEVLEHVPDPNQMVAEFARVLRPGGRALVTVPFASALHQLPYDYYRYTPNGIHVLFERHGLVVDTVETRGNMADALGALCANWLLRTVGAKSRHHDGSASLSRWRAPFALPLIAMVQLVATWIGRVSDDRTLAVGHLAIARKPESAGAE